MGIKINHYNLSIRDSSREPVCPGIREAVMYWRVTIVSESQNFNACWRSN